MVTEAAIEAWQAALLRAGPERRRALMLRTARHEAAHCVVGLICDDMPLVEVSLFPHPLTRTLSLYEDESETPMPTLLVRAMVATLAGAVADERMGLRAEQWVSIADFQLADRFARDLIPSRLLADAVLRGLRPLTIEAVHDAWPTIEVVAVALATEGRLTGEQVQHIAADRLGDLGWYYRAQLSGVLRNIAPLIESRKPTATPP